MKLVNIHAGDVADANQRIILGLIWTLIMHVSVLQGIIKDPNQQHTGQGFRGRS